MKFFSKHIAPVLILVFGIALTSCRSDNSLNDYDWTDTLDGEVRIVMKLAALDQGTGEPGAPVEKVKSLRVILLSDGYIEINELLDLDRHLDVGEFRYIYTTDTYEGHKEFFFIANEESVDGPVTLQPTDENIKLPADLDTSTLTALLDSFEADEITGPTTPSEPEDTDGPDGPDNSPSEMSRGEIFKQVLNSIAFVPKYETENYNEESVIYLPYTAYYPGFDIEKDEKGNFLPANYIEQPFYLVPVANKFFFKFVNHRQYQVEVQEINIGGIAASNYIFPQLDEKEQYRGQRKDIWWIDWLRNISEESGQYFPDVPTNEGFNNLNGWIDLYSMPGSAYPQGTNPSQGSDEIPGWITLLDETKKFEVNGYSADNGPGQSMIGPFFIPESNYRVERDVFDALGNIVPQEVQEYYLTLKIYDPINQTYADFNQVGIGNLKSLFRNTAMTVTITMRNWDDNGAYAEPQPWVTLEKNGFISEEE